MRRAGYEVRVLPEEDLGWEENPPTLIEFIRRDQRWCQGTLQYWPLPVHARPEARSAASSSPFAMLMFLGSPAWIGLLVVGTLALAMRADAGRFHPTRMPAMRCSRIILVMWFAPKIATVIDVLTRPELRRAFGGTARFLASVVDRDGVLHPAARRSCGSATRCSSPACRSAASIGWIGQVRDDHTVPLVAWRCSSCGRTPRSAWRRSALARRHASGRDSLCASCSPAGPRCRSRSRCSPRGPRVGRAAHAHRHRPAARGDRAAARAHGARAARGHRRGAPA